MAPQHEDQQRGTDKEGHEIANEKPGLRDIDASAAGTVRDGERQGRQKAEGWYEHDNQEPSRRILASDAVGIDDRKVECVGDEHRKDHRRNEQDPVQEQVAQDAGNVAPQVGRNRRKAGGEKVRVAPEVGNRLGFFVITELTDAVSPIERRHHRARTGATLALLMEPG
ncbi:hypothetical protein [Bradyrhizobium diazoefficiens]|uniref:hypothetical protein n=1 Tax=Bradyrhizobium diazoefficiens TaxID=1355477 RepID=UPI003515B18B